MNAITREEKIISGENLTPITRKEMFLAKAAGQNIETPIPITREEMFLSKISGGNDNSIVGTWVFNDELNFDGLTVGKEYWINFTYTDPDSTKEKLGFKYAERADGVYALNYDRVLGSTVTLTLAVYHTDTLWGMPKGWVAEWYKTITFAEEPTDTEFITWLKENAVKQTASATPTAYTVSSVDELPSNAVDGSMAIVEGIREALKDTIWFFDEYIASSGNAYEISSTFDFVSRVPENYNTLTQLGMTVRDLGDYIDISYLPDFSGIYDDGWSDNSYRHIEFITEPNTKIAEFIMTHATKQSGELNYITVQSLYTHENGQWVYKCEVV